MSSNYLLSPPNVTDLIEKGYLTVEVTDEVIACINAIFSAGLSFFREDKSVKSLCSISSLREGWKDIGSEFSIDVANPDLAETFVVKLRSEQYVSETYPQMGLRLYDMLSNYIAICDEIERHITRSLMQYFGKGEAPELNCSADSEMFCLYYQPDLHERALLQEAHEDSLYLTIVKSSDKGLEILQADGSFQPVMLKKNELFVMPGEIIALMTGNLIKPLIHRVVKHEQQKERISLAYFIQPNVNNGETIEPWLKNHFNQEVDIAKRVMYNQYKFFVN